MTDKSAATPDFSKDELNRLADAVWDLRESLSEGRFSLAELSQRILDSLPLCEAYARCSDAVRANSDDPIKWIIWTERDRERFVELTGTLGRQLADTPLGKGLLRQLQETLSQDSGFLMVHAFCAALILGARVVADLRVEPELATSVDKAYFSRLEFMLEDEMDIRSGEAPPKPVPPAVLKEWAEVLKTLGRLPKRCRAPKSASDLAALLEQHAEDYIVEYANEQFLDSRYAALLEQHVRHTPLADKLNAVTSQVDRTAASVWLRFEYDGQPIEWRFSQERDSVAPAFYDALNQLLRSAAGLAVAWLPNHDEFNRVLVVPETLAEAFDDHRFVERVQYELSGGEDEDDDDEDDE